MCQYLCNVLRIRNIPSIFLTLSTSPPLFLFFLAWCYILFKLLIYELDYATRIVCETLLAHILQIIACIDRAGNNLSCWVVLRTPRVIDLLDKLGVILARLRDNRVTCNGSVSSNASLQLKLDELVSARLLVLLNPIQILLDPMDEDDIDTLTLEELCEVDLDGFAEVVHRALLHDSI